MGHIQGLARNQLTLFPDSLDDFISAENPVRFLDAFVDTLGMELLGFEHAIAKETGRSPYHRCKYEDWTRGYADFTSLD